jgi:pimeloyl-ACP methyl ester carboxylesterase
MPTADPALHPRATSPSLFVESGGEDLLGVLHLPAGAGPHPVVVVMPGFPGHEYNVDLPAALRRIGYAVVVFQYRGSWGVGGAWSWRNVLADAERVLAAVKEPAMVEVHRLNPRRVALVGSSVGGFAALMTAAADPSVAAVATVAAFDPGVVLAGSRADPAARAAFIEVFSSELLPPLGGHGEALVAEIEAAGPGWALAGLAERLGDRPVLLLATRESAARGPMMGHHRPLVQAYRDHPLPRFEHAALPVYQSAPDYRSRLAGALVDFLDRRLRG